MNRGFSMLACLAGLLSGFLFCTPETASAQIVIQWATPTGSATTDGDVNAAAVFTLTATDVTVTLTNLEANVTADGQQISGIQFNAIGAAAHTGSLVTMNQGNITTLEDPKNSNPNKGHYTAGISDSLAHWQASQAGVQVHLTTLSGGKPDELILGPDDHGGSDPTQGEYTNANSSIFQHNPSVLGTATFHFSIADVTDITNVVFGFGTGTATVTGSLSQENRLPSNVPEPGVSALLAAVGLGAVGLAARRRRAR